MDKIKVTKPSGKVSVEYYSQKTNLLLREEKTEEIKTATLVVESFDVIAKRAESRKAKLDKETILTVVT
jgi:hypothetical protein